MSIPQQGLPARFLNAEMPALSRPRQCGCGTRDRWTRSPFARLLAGSTIITDVPVTGRPAGTCICAILTVRDMSVGQVLTSGRCDADAAASRPICAPLDLSRSDCDGAASCDKGSGIEIATGDEHENLERERCHPLLCRSGDQVPSGWNWRRREAHRRGLLHRPSLRPGLLPGLRRRLDERSRAVFDTHQSARMVSRLPDRAPRNCALGATIARTASMTAGVHCRCAVLNCKPPCRSARKE